MKDGYNVTCILSSNILLDKSCEAKNLQKECLCNFISVISQMVLMFNSENSIWER